MFGIFVATNRLKTQSIYLGLSVLLLSVIASILTLGVRAQGLPATVAWAKSGQTLELLAPLSSDLPVETVRLTGILAPEIGQAPWDQQAKDCLEARVYDQRVRVVPTETAPDSYGRIWAEVWRGSELINATLLENGCVLVDETTLATQSHCRELVYAQERARILGLGIWNPQTPLRLHPHEFSPA
ncbi:MAG: thermonuclease family protein [Leptolyngbyaceae cyanobacterium]